ncbi:hypothetical protein MTO96_000693 [Rhipicephalus appendiculatus]
MDLSTTETSCKCHPTCTDRDYYKEISKDTLANFMDKHDDLRKRLLAKVTVYYHTFTSENAFAVPLYDGNSVLNNFGRINGIYLGVSFLVILRLLDTVVRGDPLSQGRHFHLLRRVRRSRLDPCKAWR